MADTTFDPNAFLSAHGVTPAQPNVPVDPLQLQQFDPDAFLQQQRMAHYEKLQSEHGTLPQQALAGIEAFGRGATLGGSDVLATQLGVTTPEAMKARAEANPLTALAGNIGGGAALVGLTGGIAAPLEAGLGGTLAARALGYGAEGALFGAGNVVSDAALGDPNLNAQKILSNIGMGAAIGSGLGVLSKAIGQVPGLLRASKNEGQAVEAGVSDGGLSAPIVDVPQAYKKARSLEELDRQVQDVKKFSNQENLFELPQKPEAVAAANRLESELQIPITDMQMESLNSQDARNTFKVTAELPGKEGEILRNSMVAQKKSLNRLLDKEIAKISPDYTPTSDAGIAGQRISEVLTQQVEGLRSELGPAIQALKNTALEETDHLPGMIEYLTNQNASKYANPKIANMFDTTGSDIQIKPYSTAMGIDQSSYKAIKQAVNALEENPKKFEQLFDVRKGLSQNIDISKLGDASREIGAAKAAMMDYIQDSVQKVVPDAQVRELFKRYAINEQNAEFIEKTIGAKIGENWRSLAAHKPEEAVIKKIFSNSAMTDALKSIMSKEEFEQTLADHLAILKQEVTDQGGFSANKFQSKISKGLPKYALDEAFKTKPESYQKIKDIITTMRAFTDDMPINPSGTAKTLWQALLNSARHPTEIAGELGTYGQDVLKNLKARSEINAQLAGQTDQNAKLKAIQGMLETVNQKMNSGVKEFFSSKKGKDITRGALLSGLTKLSSKEYNEHVKTIQTFAANPQVMMNHLADNSAHLHQAAPQITQSIQTSVMKGVQFLQSKIPQALNQFPLSQPWEPSQAQKIQFQTYYNAVNEPLSVLKDLKNGSLTNETMEALRAVHPELLQEMQSKILEKMDEAHLLPFGQRVSLSKFMGQPLDGNLTAQGIAANQMALNLQASQQSAPKQGRKTGQGGLAHLQVSQLKETSLQKGLDQK